MAQNNQLMAEFMDQMISRLGPEVGRMVDAACQARMGSQTALPATAGGGGCPLPSTRGQFYPSVNLPGCPVNCDPCQFPSIETDLRLFSWPEIESEMWDTDTKISQVISGAFPVAAGGSVTLEQEARRQLTWIPDCVQIATTWAGTPQPGLLSYQWATGSKGVATAQIQFSNPQSGQQYECGDDCLRVPFPTYKGCDSIAIGALSSLRLIVSLSAAATSTLDAMTVTVYHRKSAKKNCCGSCGMGGACTCG